MNRNRIFRLLVCLILVCCLIIQVSPIRAKAIAIVDDLAIGYAALLILAACGVIFCPQTAKDVTAIGNSMSNDLRKWGEATGKTTDVEIWLAGITLYDAMGGDNDRPTEDYKVKLARGILAGIATWVCSVVIATTDVEVEEEAEVGFAYYNGVLLPDIDLVWTDKETYPYACLTYTPSTGYSSLAISSGPFYYDSSGDWRYTYTTSSDYVTCQEYYSYSDGAWTTWAKSTSYHYSGWHKLGGGLPHWTNYEVISYGGSKVLVEATDPVDFLTTILYPETYVGDIPQKIQDGEENEETLIIPDINYGPLIQDGLSLEQSLQDTMQQLKDGTLTYDEFMEQIKVEEETDPDPSEDPSEDPSTSVDGDTWKPPTDPNAFALDLSNYFPFCIPFDLYDFLACLNADPVAPVIEWELALPGGSTYPIELDLSPFDSVAKLLRRLQLLLFCVGLAFKTRDLIKG